MKDYDVDWTDWLPDGDTISSCEVTAEQGITLGETTINSAGTIVKQWISGGIDARDYKVTYRITTVQGRVDEQDIMILLREL